MACYCLSAIVNTQNVHERIALMRRARLRAMASWEREGTQRGGPCPDYPFESGVRPAKPWPDGLTGSQQDCLVAAYQGYANDLTDARESAQDLACYFCWQNPGWDQECIHDLQVALWATEDGLWEQYCEEFEVCTGE